MSPCRRWATLLLAAGGIAALFYAGFIPAKAQLAQLLLEDAWQRRLAGADQAHPWPWADTQPLARLRQPRLGVAQVVLAGASGRVLAFGPGHVTGSAAPGTPGNVVLSGHRDTHFRWLRALRRGDELLLESADGRLRRYAVAVARVHPETASDLLDPLAGDQLRLVTCFPFDALESGTPLRYVVTAYPLPAR
jgi:sortase A